MQVHSDRHRRAQSLQLPVKPKQLAVVEAHQRLSRQVAGSRLGLVVGVVGPDAQIAPQGVHLQAAQRLWAAHAFLLQRHRTRTMRDLLLAVDKTAD